MMRAWMMVALLAAPAEAWAWGDPLEKLAKRLEKEIAGQPNKKVAVLSFPYHDGATSSGSSIIQERLTTFLAGRGKVEVIERSLLKKVLEERKLELTGLIDAKTSSELGRVLGVAALVTGTLNDVGDRAEVNARVIEAESGRILAAAQARVERTWTDAPVLAGPAPVPPAPAPVPVVVAPPAPDGKPLIQLALLLDTSNSMDGLLDQAKSQLWRIVNDLSRHERGGAGSTVQVAVYEYGNSGLAPSAHWLRQIVPFTGDLDRVSEALFALRTNGGSEFAGAAIQHAALHLPWSARTDVYKAIFIAGNEPFTQGPVDFRAAAAAAAAKGVVVNTIYCGMRQAGVAEQWLAGAQAGGGEFLAIDQSLQAATLRAPQDAELERLGRELNDTFVPYGDEGRGAFLKQAAQDRLAAAAAPGAAPERAAFKASAQYLGAGWDAVAAVAGGGVRAEELKEEALPPAARGLSAPKRKEYLESKLRARRALQERIRRLDAERRAYLARETATAGRNATFDEAVVAAVRRQAARKGLTRAVN